MSTSFWDKLVYADRIEFLDEVLTNEQISELPEEHKQYDKELDSNMFQGMDELANASGVVIPRLDHEGKPVAPE